MPSYGNYPVEGYAYNEPGGRPRPGHRYRNPMGDRRVLYSMAGLFFGGLLLTFGWAWMERANTLTEWAFGDDRVACSLTSSGGPVPGPLDIDGSFKIVMDAERVLAERPDVRDAAGFALTIDLKDESGRELLGSDRRTFDTRTVDWSTTKLRFTTPTDLGGTARRTEVVMCDLLLEAVVAPDDLGTNAVIPDPVIG